MLVEVREGVVLDAGRPLPQRLPVVDLGHHAARLARIVPVAWARLRRSWVSASAARAATGNGGIPRNVGVLGAS